MKNKHSKVSYINPMKVPDDMDDSANIHSAFTDNDILVRN
jgi:hypothetical protein